MNAVLLICRNDSEINSRTVLVLSQGGKETPTQWRDVIVGDIVKVMQDQEVPADIVCLSTSDEEHLCHVETANLVGAVGGCATGSCAPKRQK